MYAAVEKLNADLQTLNALPHERYEQFVENIERLKEMEKNIDFSSCACQEQEGVEVKCTKWKHYHFMSEQYKEFQTQKDVEPSTVFQFRDCPILDNYHLTSRGLRSQDMHELEDPVQRFKDNMKQVLKDLNKNVITKLRQQKQS